MEVDLHYQLGVAKRVDTEPWNSVNGGQAKVCDTLLLPVV